MTNTATLYGPHRAFRVEATGQPTEAAQYRPLIVAYRDGAPVRLDELGDVIDSAETLEAEKGFLQRVQREFLKLPGPRHYVLGNHCVSGLTKPEFLEIRVW